MSLEFVSLNNAASSIVMLLFVLSPWKTFICIVGRQDGGGREERKRKGGRASKVQRHAGVGGRGAGCSTSAGEAKKPSIVVGTSLDASDRAMGGPQLSVASIFIKCTQ